MNVDVIAHLHELLVKAAVYSEDLEVPLWRFDGKAIEKPEEVAAALGIPLIEAKEHMRQKDIYGGTGAGGITRGVGTRMLSDSLVQRANTLMYGKRRRRRHKRRSEQ